MLNFVYVFVMFLVFFLMYLMYINNNLKSLVFIVKIVNMDIKCVFYFQIFNFVIKVLIYLINVVKIDWIFVQNWMLVFKCLDVCDLCFLYYYIYILDNEEICSVGVDKRDVKVIVFIFIIYVNIVRRKVF